MTDDSWLSEQGRVERDADRAEFLDRISRLVYETEMMGEDDMSEDLRKLLRQYEQAWKIKASEGYEVDPREGL